GVADQEALRPLAQGQVDQRRVLVFDREEIGDHAHDGAPGAWVGLVQPAQYLTDPGTEALLAALQSFENLHTAGHAAALLAQARDQFAGLVAQALEAVALVAQLAQR